MPSQQFFSCLADVICYCGAPTFLIPLQSLTGPEGQLFSSRLGGAGLHPGDAPTLLEPASPISNVPIHW